MTLTPVIGIMLVIVGLIAGVMAGMFGIGGGVIIVPALMLLGFTQKMANGTSLTALLLPVAILAVREYYLAGLLNVRLAALLAVGIVFGSYVGASIALGLEAPTLSRAYGLFLIYVFWRFAEPVKWWREFRKTAPPPQPSKPENPDAAWWAMLLLGVVAGILSGMFGIGGGVIIVYALVTLLNFDQKRANGTSLGALLLPVSLPAVVGYYNRGELDLGVAGLVALGLLFGALIGARITLKLPSTVIKRAYGVFLLILSIRFLFPQWFGVG